MDESLTLMLHVRAGKTSVERKPKVKGDGLGSGNGAVGETGREGCREAMLVPFVQRGGRGDSRAQGRSRQTGERREEDKRGGGGLTEEEEAGTRLTLRPCRMHKARTRQQTSNEMTS